MIRIVTDSTADLWQEYVEKRNLTVIPMHYRLGDKNYLATPDTASPYYLDDREFYGLMRVGVVAGTTQINQAQYEEAFAPLLDAGDDILYLAFSSGLTGSQNNARLAWEELKPRYPGRRLVMVDTKAASMGEGLAVWMVAERFAAQPELTLDELAAYAGTVSMQVHHWFTVDDLKYLKRSGRVSGAAAVVGTVLNIKPVLHVDNEGHLIAVEKVQGRKKALRRLVEQLEAHMADKQNGAIFIGHCDAPQDAFFVDDLILQKTGRRADKISGIGPVIGSHSGPGTLALFFVSEEER
ncbi:MAG: DegV family protein [Clostridia bacterium]|nr:DegV family protein [Clostridia bacterium]